MPEKKSSIFYIDYKKEIYGRSFPYKGHNYCILIFHSKKFRFLLFLEQLILFV